MWIRAELTNSAGNSNRKKGKREEKGREEGFLQEVKRNIFVWRNITDKNEDCTSESLPLSPLVKQDEMRTRLERNLNQQMSRSQWKLAQPLCCILHMLLPCWTTEALFWWIILAQAQTQAQAKSEAQAELWLPWILPSLCSPEHTPPMLAGQRGISPDCWEHHCPKLRSSELGLSKRSPGGKD